MSAQSRDVWNSFAGRQQTSDLGSESGTGFPRSFYQSAVATGTSDCPRFSDENSSASSHSYDFRNQCHSSKPAVLGDRNNVGHYATNACPLDLNRFQSQPFLGQRSEFVVPLRASPSPPSSAEVPRVKKPLNAFMIFMREMRHQVADECAFRESAVINQFLGRKWNSMDRSEQMKYYDMARREKELHGQLHPFWSARDNYSKKRKRKETPRGYESEEAAADGFLGAKKCRARFGMDKQLWCKSCRLKKRCARFLRDTNSNSKENHLENHHSMSSCLNVSNSFGFCASKTLNCDGSEARRVLKDVQPMESRVLPFHGGHGTYSSTSDQGRSGSGGFPRQGFCTGGFSSANYGARVYSMMTNQSQLHGQSDDYLGRDCWSVCEDAAPDLGEKSFSLADRSTGFVFPSDASPFNPYVDTRPLTSAWNVGVSQGQPYGGFEPFVSNEDAGFPGLEGRSGSSVDRQTFPDRSFGSHPGVWAVCASSPGLVSCNTGSAQPYWKASSSCYPICRQGLYHSPTDFAVDMYSAALPVSRLCSLGPQVMGSYERHPHQSSCVSGYEVSSSFDSVGDQGLGSCPGSMHASDQLRARSPALSEDGFVVFLGGCLAMYLLALLASSVAFVMFACILFLVL